MKKKGQLELAVVVPTFNERGNVAHVLQRLAAALDGIEYELILVDDDSPERTAAVIRGFGIVDPRIRVLQRVHRRGLSSACIVGMMATSAPFIAVMDADLQHDETILSEMLARLEAGDLDIAIGTRNALGGSMGEFSASRVRLSNLGRSMIKFNSRIDPSQPKSRVFIVNPPILDQVFTSVSGIGFKILLDVLASSRRPVRFTEVPYRFGERVYGESKLDILVGLEYLQLLLDKVAGGYIPVRFLIFGMVGSIGAAVHLSVLYAVLNVAHESFAVAQGVATVFVMTLNFFLNNAITYRDRRLKGLPLLTGLATFYVACSIGALLNIRVASFALGVGFKWYAAGIIGVSLSSVWNYAVTAVFTWHQHRSSISRRTSAAARSDERAPQATSGRS